MEVLPAMVVPFFPLRIVEYYGSTALASSNITISPMVSIMQCSMHVHVVIGVLLVLVGT